MSYIFRVMPYNTKGMRVNVSTYICVNVSTYMCVNVSTYMCVNVSRYIDIWGGYGQ